MHVNRALVRETSRDDELRASAKHHPVYENFCLRDALPCDLHCLSPSPSRHPTTSLSSLPRRQPLTHRSGLSPVRPLRESCIGICRQLPSNFVVSILRRRSDLFLSPFLLADFRTQDQKERGYIPVLRPQDSTKWLHSRCSLPLDTRHPWRERGEQPALPKAADILHPLESVAVGSRVPGRSPFGDPSVFVELGQGFGCTIRE